MKFRNNKILVLLLATLFIVSCEKPYNFDREFYHNVVYLLSDDDNFNQYKRAMVNLDKDEDVVYLTVGVGGSLAPKEDIDVELKLNYDTLKSLWGKENKSTKDIKYKEWSKILPKKYYRFDKENMSGDTAIKATISAGKINVKIPIYVKNLSSLSPDSLYMLDFKLMKTSNNNINNKKDEVLMPIYWKNNWSNTKEPEAYDLYGEQGENKKNTATKLLKERVLTSSPSLYPLAKNKLRMPAGIESISKNDKKTELEMINTNSIVIVVNDDNTIDFEQYDKSAGVLVEKIEPTSVFYDENYNNTYKLETKIYEGVKTYYKTFRLHYMYKRVGGDYYDPENRNKNWVFCKVILKRQYNPNIE